MKRVSLGRTKGFTLLELLIVVVVLAVLAGLALPQYFRTVARSKEAEGWQNLSSVRGSLFRYYSEDAQLPAADDFGSLDIDDPNANASRLFDYTFTTAIPNFTITATPISAGPRTLTLDDAGARTSQ